MSLYNKVLEASLQDVLRVPLDARMEIEGLLIKAAPEYQLSLPKKYCTQEVQDWLLHEGFWTEKDSNGDLIIHWD